MKPIKGTKNRIIFQVAEAESKSAIIIPDERRQVTRGVIVRVTEKDEDGLTPVVKEGDEVLFSKGAFMEKFTYKDEDYYTSLENIIITILN